MNEMELGPEQMEAVQLCISSDPKHKLVGVTGQAGTGKTTIIQQVYDHYQAKLGAQAVAVCAPTGKAAKRIKEATGIDAMTIHRLLEFPMPNEITDDDGKVVRIPGQPSRNARNNLTQSIILVDEAAMISTELYRSLIDAIPSGGKLRLFGDANQLPPVEKETIRGEPSPFVRTLNKFPSVVLKNIYRQAENSSIIAVANDVIKGRTPRRSNDFNIHISTASPVNIALRIVAENLKRFTSTDAQLITPTNKGASGVTKMNDAIQGIVFPDRTIRDGLNITLDAELGTRIKLFVGDKIIWTRNNYDLNIFNGETGIVTNILSGHVWIDFGDREVEVPRWIDNEKFHYDPRTNLQLAYAVTTHKAQGSEYEHVIYLMTKSASFALSRNNLYTGITRAKKMVDLVTDQQALRRSLNTVIQQRI